MTAPVTLIEAFDPIDASLSASVIDASALAPAPPNTSVRFAISALATASLLVRVFTVSVDASVAISGRSPSKFAFVPPSTVAFGYICETPMTPTSAPAVCAVALLSAIASTNTAPPSTVSDAVDPTSASVSARLVIEASAIALLSVNRPNSAISALAVALFNDVACTVNDEATPAFVSTTSAFSSALVPPATIAVGFDDPNATMPPPPTSASASAVWSDIAVIRTAPATWIEPVDASVASTSAVLVISALAPPPVIDAAAPSPPRNASASALLSPSACTVSAPEPVIPPSILARTAAPTVAAASTVPSLTNPVSKPMAIAWATLASFCPASTHTSPVTSIKALAPIEASLSAPIIDASACAPVPEPSSVRFRISALASALLPVRVRTVSDDASVATLGRIPSKPAFVPPSTVAVGYIRETPMTPPSTPAVCAVALLSEIASTNTAPPSTVSDAVDPTNASVSARLVIEASAIALLSVNRPNSAISALAVALFNDVACTVNDEATPAFVSTTSAFSSALVPPATIAVGFDDPNATMPPPPTSASASAV